MAGMKHGAWCHIEIPTASVDAAKRFYGGVFGWKFTDVPEMKYTLYTTGDGEVGGGLFDPPAGVPRAITNYVLVNDLDESARKIPEFGGRVVTDRMEVPGMGWFRVVLDPDGNSFSLWQPAKAKAPAPKKAAKKPAVKAKKKRR